MRILVVEDEHRIAQAIRKGLEQERYAVDVAFTGNQALDKALSEEYDLILLDLMLPELDGETVCRTLREKQIHTPILMLTAKDQTDNIVTGLDTGADDYLTKPFSFTELLARVRALLRRPIQTHDSILKLGDLTLDTKQFVVTRAEQKIQLSQKEFSVLEYLLRHPKQIVSKETLMQHVWNYDANILPNTVEVTVKNIRRKLEEPAPKAATLIHTVRGFGYKLEN